MIDPKEAPRPRYKGFLKIFPFLLLAMVGGGLGALKADALTSSVRRLYNDVIPVVSKYDLAQMDGMFAHLQPSTVVCVHTRVPHPGF